MAQEYEIYNSQYTAQQIENQLTNAVPRINPTTYQWEVYNIATGNWTSTGVMAKGNGIERVEMTADYKLKFYFENGSTWTSNSIRGEQGVSITNVSISSTGYLTITLSNGQTWTSSISLIGPQGEPGEDGLDASVSQTLYGVSNSATTAPTTWSETMPVLIGGQYLWTKLVWNTEAVSYVVTRQGIDGEGTGDMTKADYDPNNVVAAAGGIVLYIQDSLHLSIINGAINITYTEA